MAAVAMAGLANGSSGDASVARETHATSRAVLEYEPESLNQTEAAAFAQLLDRGIADIESLVAPSLPPWAQRTGPVRFIVSSEVPISRTYGRTVLLPVQRVRTRSAPYLHESVHVLVPVRGDRVWLSEGLASYLESWVSENLGGYDAHIFTRAGDRDIHGAARRWLGSEGGRAVLPFVGQSGSPPDMEEDRLGVARPFYVLSHSFTKHLVDAVGLDRVVRLATEGGVPSAFTRETGRSEQQWKEAWLAAINPG